MESGTSAIRDDSFRRAFDAAASGVALVARDGRIRAANASLCAMLGYGAAELRRLGVGALAHPDDPARYARIHARVDAGALHGFSVETRCVHRNGRLLRVVLAITAVRDAAGRPDFYVWELSDVSARAAAEEAAAYRAAQLERANEELEQFPYIVSHDLQEPLRLVASYALLLAERYRGALDDRADRWIAYIVSGVERMQRLIEGLLALARVGSDTRAMAQVDIAGIAARTWEGLQSRHPDIGARISFGPLPTLLADGAQIEQLFQNLLGNAMKYRRPAVPLAVGVTSEERTDDRGVFWEFAVRDNGIGLDMTQSKRIFEVFQRLYRGSEYEGTGIGLAICKKIVERHGGRIWVRSIPGEGSVFSFTLRERAS